MKQVIVGELVIYKNGNHISIRRKDRKPFNPTWEEMYTIKNDVIGIDKWAIEIFPPITDLVDNNNFRHLWIVDSNDIPTLKNKKSWKKHELE